MGFALAKGDTPLRSKVVTVISLWADKIGFLLVKNPSNCMLLLSI